MTDNNRPGEVERLSPCPFCGGTDVRIYSPSFPMVEDFDEIVVRCRGCDSAGPTLLFDQIDHDETDVPRLVKTAVTGWNTRALTQQEKTDEAR